MSWQSFASCAAVVPEKLRPWLAHTGSFMQKLQAHAVHDAKVSVLHQDWGKPLDYEKIFLSSDENTLIREVLIGSPTQLWMYARSVFPESTFTAEESLANLGDKPLGEFLFNHADMQRSEFKIKILLPAELWARCSLFYLKNKKLLLTEILSPTLMELHGA